ncbi:tetratricopeptide repeat protein [Massilia sp. CFBP9012]|uniref:O-linked N-acetylglucosamine transferase, SPINDLY family protein n=1 Tax=Massilia sp. CFBP9012 TaxID=3096531 RepID=UPI002A6AE2D1|nr:tetratricopeptide repeat protein [Massilia sp. CFBP9012]MDY0975357.1 tetratricopeptide repeat protein [Massilia sp. CFBP9012]
MSTLPPSADVRQIVDQAMQAAHHETEAGNVDQALALYGAVLDLQPGHAGAHHAVAVLAIRAGDAEVAMPHFAAALEADPDQEAHWLAYLDALIAARQFSAAAQLLQLGRTHGLQGPVIDDIERQLASSGAPDSAEIDAAAALFAEGRSEEAYEVARALVERFPQHPFGWKLLGGIYHRRGEAQGALHAMAMSARFDDDDLETLNNLGTLLMRANRLDEAENVLRRVIARQPGNVDTLNQLAITLSEQGNLSEGYATATAALALDPQHENSTITLALILQAQGRAAEAVAAYRTLLKRRPENIGARSNMLFCMNEIPGLTPDALFREHLHYGELVERNTAPSLHWDNTPEPERRLRIGFVSGDLRNHAVAAFIEPVFERLGQRPGLALHAYYNHSLNDSVTARLRGHLPHWRDITELDDDALARLVRADGIDILIDLSGHTSFNRLPAFARRLAPVQASWLGYPGTTGLAAMDYYLADRKFLPHGQYDHLFSEKLLQLPMSIPFHPVTSAPDVGPLPALANGHVTFGSFNRLSKFNREVIQAWGTLLRALPDARLLVAGMPEQDDLAQLRAWLDQEGIAAHRVDFHGRIAMHDYLALHGQVDLCLDTFPYTGGTTTMHAGWMGVPTLTLDAGTVSGRQTACILEHWGLHHFVAHGVDDFVAKGLAICTDLPALAAVRATLRERYALPTSDSRTRVADGIEHALRLIWRRWCQGLPPQSFEATLPPSPSDATPRSA